jgi:FAD/FMN-containing dehydrogenase
MIVRLMGEGQFRVDDSLATQLNELDEQAVAALERSNEVELDRTLDAMWRMVKAQGERLPDDEIVTSDVLIPPSDLTLEETRRLFSEHGLVPDLPV